MDADPAVSLLVTDVSGVEKNGDLTDESGLPALIDSVLAAVAGVRGSEHQARAQG